MTYACFFDGVIAAGGCDHETVDAALPHAMDLYRQTGRVPLIRHADGGELTYEEATGPLNRRADLRAAMFRIARDRPS